MDRETWLNRLLASVLCCALPFLFCLGCGNAPASQGKPVAPANSSAATAPPLTADEVRITVDYSTDRKIEVVSVLWSEGLTVLDALALAKPLGIEIEVIGEGAGALLTEINGVKNEAGGEGTKNWIYYVNNNQATASAGIYALRPGDVIVWRFESYQ